MSVATGTAIALGAGAAASIGGAAIGSSIQGNATDRATRATSNAAANSLAFNKQVYGTTLENEQPYMAVGSQAAGQLGAGISDGSLTAGYPGGPFSFSGVNETNDPAYQFDLSQGQQAVQRSAAAQGGLVSGGALKDLDTFSQGYASNQYQQSYSNALAAYNQAYGQFENTQSNKFNRLSSLAGLGQNAVTGTATSGNAAAGTNANVNTSTANSLSNLYTGQGNAAAAAFGAGANALTGAGNTYANYLAQQAQQSSQSSYNNNQGSTYTPAPMGNVSPSQWNAYDATAL